MAQANIEIYNADGTVQVNMSRYTSVHKEDVSVAGGFTVYAGQHYYYRKTLSWSLPSTAKFWWLPVWKSDVSGMIIMPTITMSGNVITFDYYFAISQGGYADIEARSFTVSVGYFM